MTLLTVQNLAKYFGERALFEDVTFSVGEQDKVGLVGDNGCGKTTLFRILSGEAAADGGGLVRANGLRIGYLEQHACADPSRTLWDEVQSVFAPLLAIEQELEQVHAALAAGDTSLPLIERQHRLQERFQREGGLTYASRVRSTLFGLGFAEEAFRRPVSTLSGGQRSKAAMGRLLLSDSQLLLLDEPTNHLDIASVEWLEEFLLTYRGAVITISHDRYFLDKVTTRTLELSHGHLYETVGNYTAHREKREHDQEVARKHYQTATREIARIEGSIAQLKQFNREKSIRAAESKEKMVDRLKAQLETPESQAPAVSFRFTVKTTGGQEVLTAEELSMGFGGQVLFRDVSFLLRRGERVFLLGPNGCGKTTLLKTLCGQLTPLSGAARLGAKVSIGYYDQTQEGLNGANSALTEIANAYPSLSETEIRGALAAFLFRGDEVFRPIAQLSGGERARLLLLKLMLARDNLLLLDEPTNHLDIASREALEQALTGYDGTLLVVSHDRYFINRLATRVLRLTPEGCCSFPGDYDTYLARFREPVPLQATDNTTAPKPNAYKQRKEQAAAARRLAGQIRRAEEDVARTEAAIRRLQEQLEAPEVTADYTRLMEVSAALEQQQAMLEEQMAAWESLLLQAEENPAVEG